MRYVFCDLDSTLCDTRQRWHLIRPGDERRFTDWVAYSMACADDAPVVGTVTLLRLLVSAIDVRIVILSGRNVAATDLTVEWLERHEVPYDGLLLRDDARFGRIPNGRYKREQILSWMIEHPHDEAFLMIDDYPAVAPHLAEIGVPTLIVDPGYSEGDAGMLAYASDTENAEDVLRPT